MILAPSISHAEYQTDVILHERYFSDRLPALVVEVGAADPVYLSMTAMWRELGCPCVCIEPNPIFAARHRAAGHDIREVAISDHHAEAEEFTLIERTPNTDHLTYECGSALQPLPSSSQGYMSDAKRHQILVKVRTLDSLALGHIDLLIVDVEGGELAVLRGLTDNPDVIVLENIADQAVYEDYEPYMRGRGYRLDHTVKHNQIYVGAAGLTRRKAVTQ